MGLNPGGDPKLPGHSTAIVDSLRDRHQFSCYVDECWQPHCDEPYGSCRHMADGSVRPEFLLRHQRNMLSLFEAMSADPRKVLSTNAVFARSTSLASLHEQTGHTLDEWWHACWPVHRKFLAQVRPRVIISLGYGTDSSAFGLLWQELANPPWRRVGEKSRRDGWAFDAAIKLPDGTSISPTVIGVPHPSYMAVGPELQSAMRQL
jgi:hypothetical protein